MTRYSSKHRRADGPGRSASPSVLYGIKSRDILSGLRNKEFRILFQPLVDLRSSKAIGLQAVLHWEHPSYGLLEEDFFSSRSCSASMREALERWAVYRACREFSAFAQDKCLDPGIKLHVNVSSSLFLESSLPSYVQGVLHDSGIAPERLCLNWSMDGKKQPASRYLRYCKGLSSMGLDLAVNDLHLDLSNLNLFYKVNFIPFAMVKLHQAEAAQLEEDSGTYESLLTFIRIFSGLGIKLVVKGVQTGRQLQLLHRLCCNYAQGSYWCEPVPLEQMRPSGFPVSHEGP